MIFSDWARRTRTVAAAALLLSPAAAMAQQAATPAKQQAPAKEVSPSHLAAAHKAIEAIHATDQFDNILLNAATKVKSELIPNNPDREEEISQMVDEKALALAPRRAALENEVARVYAQLFTEDELNAIASFYQSEAGKKLLAQGARRDPRDDAGGPGLGQRHHARPAP